MKFKIVYKLPPDPVLHSRYYTALNVETAQYMFNETVANGSLLGEEPEIVEIYKLVPMKWKKVKK